MPLQQAGKFWLFFASFWAFTAACWAAPSIPQALRDKSLIYCTNISGFSFNPQKADIGTNMNVVTEQIYDKLLDLDPQTQALKPALAETFSLSEDGLTITLNLRRKVAFHNTEWFTPTRDFNAEDVIFSLNRAMGKADDLPALNRASQEGQIYHRQQSDVYQRLASRTHSPYFESVALESKIARIYAPHAHQVKIELVKPDRAFLAHLASQYAVILSKEYALQLNADNNLPQLDLLPVGTGVYRLQSYVPNEYVRLHPHQGYWGKPAKVANMIVDFSADGTGRMAKFLNNECDLAAFPEPSQLSTLKEGHLISNKGANLAYLAFNFQQERMQDINLRQHIAQAINRERLASLNFYGQAEVAQNVLPQALWPEKNPASYAHLPQNLKLDKPLRLWVIDEKRVYNLHPLKMAELIRADLVRAGLKVEVRQVSRAYLVQQLATGQANYDMILGGWLATNFDPLSFLSPLLACQAQQSVTNLANWCHLEFDRLLQDAESSPDPLQGQLIYQVMQRLLQEELPILPLVHANRLLIAKERVHKAHISPFGQVNLAELEWK
ncbi:peptide ABC transporter substrate-binding protein [Pasteurellaceae bacterium RH1A]|nr:peptide ABC transporter substrate-binding protein [Pasteurellaceae bacterium RH1A]